MSDILKEIPEGFETDTPTVQVEPEVSSEQDEFLDDGFFEDTFGNEKVEEGIPEGLEEDNELVNSLLEEEEGEELEEEGLEEEELEEEELEEEALEEEELEEEELEEELEEGELEEEEEDAMFYDPERDYPDEDNLAPNVYKTEQDATIGLVSKGSYIEKLSAKLEELGSGIGAIELPEILKGDLENLDSTLNIEAVSTMPPEQKKEAVKQLDQFITSVKSKIDRVESVVQKQEVSKEAQQKIDTAFKTIDTSLKVFNLDFNKISSMSDAEVFAKIDSQINALEAKADTEIVDRGYAAFKQDLEALHSARNDLKQAQKDILDANQKKEQVASASQEVTPEQIQKSYDEFRADRPDLWIFKAETGDPEESFVKTVKQQGWPVATPRDWSNAFKKFDAMVNTRKTKEAVKELRKEATKTKTKTAKKKKPRIVQPTNPNRPIDTQWDDELDTFTEEIFG